MLYTIPLPHDLFPTQDIWTPSLMETSGSLNGMPPTAPSVFPSRWFHCIFNAALAPPLGLPAQAGGRHGSSTPMGNACTLLLQHQSTGESIHHSRLPL